MVITLLDTSVGSNNLGDEIIMQSIKEWFNDVISQLKNYCVLIYYVPTHLALTSEQKNLLIKSDIKIICGTNLFNMLFTPLKIFNEWKISFYEFKYFRNVLLLGVGTQISNKSKFKTIRKIYSRYMWKKILSHWGVHSVRDNLSKIILNELGFNNVINTGCPTLWKLSKQHCQDIPDKKGRRVVFTVTDYNKNYFLDNKMIEILLENYEEVYAWPQSKNDYEYIKNLVKKFKNKIEILANDLQEYDLLLKNKKDVDYVGTRLHGGIRALQFKRRTLIIAVDNRARSFHKEFNIPILDRENIQSLPNIINSAWKTEIDIDYHIINQYKESLESIMTSTILY